MSQPHRRGPLHAADTYDVIGSRQHTLLVEQQRFVIRRYVIGERPSGPRQIAFRLVAGDLAFDAHVFVVEGKQHAAVLCDVIEPQGAGHLEEGSRPSAEADRSDRAILVAIRSGEPKFAARGPG